MKRYKISPAVPGNHRPPSVKVVKGPTKRAKRKRKREFFFVCLTCALNYTYGVL